MISRRRFIQASSAAGLALSGITPSIATPHRVQPPIRIQPQKKALVFIMLEGGNDSFNMLVPTTGEAHAQYRDTRSNLALNADQLLPLGDYQDHQGRRFGVHYNMPEVQQLFEQKQLAFVANIAPMIEPISKATYLSGEARVPLGLLSHSDQAKHWQTSRPHERLNQGWFGYLADALQPNRPATQIPMNISLAGNNLMQHGTFSNHYSITEQGSVGLVFKENESPFNQLLLNGFEALFNVENNADPFQQTYATQTREAQIQHEIFHQATDNISVPEVFSDTPLSQQLRKVTQTLQAADRLNHQQQTFYLRYGGWDHHDELLDTQAGMLRVLSQALSEFQQALNSLDLAQQVITFTGSDFGRTLTSNGHGTDHGWGGNVIVMSPAIGGGVIYGDYPPLALGDSNPFDLGDGLMLPTLSTDHMYVVLAQWFGVEAADLPRLFPNWRNFTLA